MKEGSRHAFSNGTANGYEASTCSNNGLSTHHTNEAGASGISACTSIVHEGVMSKKKHCRCCKAVLEGRRRHVVCGYCQHPVCADSCINKCDVCENYFCLFCTVLNYDRPETRTFCSDCLQHFTWQ